MITQIKWKAMQYYQRLILWLIKPVIGPLFNELVDAIDELRARKIDWDEVNVLMDNKIQKK